MAQIIIYANGETTGSSFHLVSEWKGKASGFEYGPTVGSATYSYSLSSLPVGAKNIKVTVFARIGVRFTPISGTAASYPRANGNKFVKVENSTDNRLYSANIEFSDMSAPAKITYSFKANGDASMGIPRSGSLSFDDVYLAVEYTPPCSDWSLSSTSEYVGETIWADIVMTEDNVDYSHKVVVLHDNDRLFIGQAEAGQSRIYIDLDRSWMELFPNATVGTVYAMLETYNVQNELIGTSSHVEIKILCSEDMLPSPGSLTVEGVECFGDSVYIQGISKAIAVASGWAGTYGSTVKRVTISGNGKTITKDLSSGIVVYGNDLTLDSGVLKSSGTVDFILTVTDSRDRSSSVKKSIFVTAYTPITILSTSQGRITNSNDEDTGYVKIDYSYCGNISYMSTAGIVSNSPRLTISWETDSVIADNYVSNSQISFAENQLLKDHMYMITLHLTDGISSTTVVRKIGPAYAYMRWDPKNNSIGFGCYPTESKSFKIADDWTLFAAGHSLNDLVDHYYGYVDDNIYLMDKVLFVGDELTKGIYLFGGNYIASESNFPYFMKRMFNIEPTIAAEQGYSSLDWYENFAQNYAYSDYDTALIWLGTNGGLTDTIDQDTTGETYEQYA